jgi:hypothetical protein
MKEPSLRIVEYVVMKNVLYVCLETLNEGDIYKHVPVCSKLTAYKPYFMAEPL